MTPTLLRRNAIKAAAALVAAIGTPQPEPAAADAVRAHLDALDAEAAIRVAGLLDLTASDLGALAWACMAWLTMMPDLPVSDPRRAMSVGEARAAGLIDPAAWDKQQRAAFGYLARVDPERLGAFSVSFVG